MASLKEKMLAYQEKYEPVHNAPYGDKRKNRQVMADSMLLDMTPMSAMSAHDTINKRDDVILQTSRKFASAAFENALAAERNKETIPGIEHLDEDFDASVSGSTLGGKPFNPEEFSATLGFIKDTIPALVGQSYKEMAGGIIQSIGEGTGESLSWRDRFKRFGNVTDTENVTGLEALDIPAILGDWAVDAIAQKTKFSQFMTEAGSAMREEAIQKTQEITPAEITFAQELMLGTATTAAIAIPGSIITGLTKNPTFMLSAFGASTYGSSYSRGRSEGLDPKKAHEFAMRDAGIEIGTEFLPAKFLVDISSGPLKRSLINFFVSEMGGESVATATQKANARLSGLEDDIPLEQWMGDLYHDLQLTWATTAIISPVQSLTARLAGKTQDTVKEKLITTPEVSERLQKVSPELTETLVEREIVTELPEPIKTKDKEIDQVIAGDDTVIDELFKDEVDLKQDVEVAATIEETGEIVTFTESAEEAVEFHRSRDEIYKIILDCVGQ